jgi:SAM-dependent methyltransferase
MSRYALKGQVLDCGESPRIVGQSPIDRGTLMCATMDSGHWDKRYAEKGFVWTSQPNRFLVAEAERLAPGRALDVACGEGRNAVWLAEGGWQVTGVDFSAVGLEKTRALARSRGVSVRCVAADLRQFTPEPSAYDLVLVFYLQVPAVERTAIVRTVAEAVAADGLFLLVGHDSSNLEHGHGGPRDPAVLYAPDDVAADLTATGLAVERAETVQRPVDTSDGPRVALDAFVRARRVHPSAT